MARWIPRMKTSWCVAATMIAGLFMSSWGRSTSPVPDGSSQLGSRPPERAQGQRDAAIECYDADGLTASYATAWDATDERYEITSVTIGGVSDTCDGQTLYASLADSTGAQIGNGSMAIPTSEATSHTVTLSTMPPAELTVRLHVVTALAPHRLRDR